MRHSHWLKPNAGVELPQHLIFIDTETLPEHISPTMEHHSLWFGWACYIRLRGLAFTPKSKREWFRFTTADELWDWVGEKAYPKTRVWLFAHNWNFDAAILNVSISLPKAGWELTKYINDKPPFILEFRRDKATLRLVDSLNYFAGSLASIGDSLGIAKLPMPKSKSNTKGWDRYCRRDIEVLVEAVTSFRAFVGEQQLGTFQSTLASQAFNAYRHRFMPVQILINGDDKANQVEREGYYGGRTECFYLGVRNEPLYYLDINSMYPSIMRSHTFPVSLQRVEYQVSPTRALERSDHGGVMAVCTVETDEPVYPYRRDSRLIFPVGRFEVTLTTGELRYAILHDHVVKISRLHIYDSEPIFTDFVDTLYRLRKSYQKANNPTFAYMCKILLNSLYGKFGQNGSKWRDLGESVAPFTGILYSQDAPDGPVRKLRHRLGVLQEYKREGESDNSFPAIAAHVTGYARMMLWGLFQKAGRENVFYTDTDSLVVSQQGYENLRAQLDADIIGRLKTEKVASSAEFWGAKDYRFGDTERHKGIKRNARQLANDRWEQERFYSWDFLLSKTIDGYVPIETVTKTLHREYKKGTPTASGWVEPIRLLE